MDIIKELNRIKTDKHKCLGCGYERNCTIKGCAIINQAIEELKKSKQSCEVMELLSQFSDDKNEPIENRLMQELIKVKSEFDISLAQLNGKCWCCKYAEKEIIGTFGGTSRNIYTCNKFKFTGLNQTCEHWEWNGGIVDGTDSN